MKWARYDLRLLYTYTIRKKIFINFQLFKKLTWQDFGKNRETLGECHRLSEKFGLFDGNKFWFVPFIFPRKTKEVVFQF